MPKKIIRFNRCFMNFDVHGGVSITYQTEPYGVLHVVNNITELSLRNRTTVTRFSDGTNIYVRV